MCKQPVKHVQQDVCFSGSAGTKNQHPKNISLHARMALFKLMNGSVFGKLAENIKKG